MKVYFSLFLILFQSLTASEGLAAKTSAKAAILINADNGIILYEKNIHTPLYPASTTKIATALYALEKKGDALNDMIIADRDSVASITPEKKLKANYQLPSHWIETDGSHMGIKVNEKMSFKHLLEGMLIVSADDAANLIAKHVSGDIPRFMEEINLYLKKMGCKNTNFTNPHGLHHPEHMTTAYDLALMARKAMEHHTFRNIVLSIRFERPETNLQPAVTLAQTNNLLKKGAHYYDNAIGIKTGWHSKALHNFVGAATFEGRTLIAVLLNCEDRKQMFKETIDLFELAFKQPKIETNIIEAGPQKYTYLHPGASSTITTYTKEDYRISYYRGEKPTIKATLAWEQVKFPVKKDQKIGEIRLAIEGKSDSITIPLYAVEEVKETWKSWIQGFRH